MALRPGDATVWSGDSCQEVAPYRSVLPNEQCEPKPDPPVVELSSTLAHSELALVPRDESLERRKGHQRGRVGPVHTPPKGSTSRTHAKMSHPTHPTHRPRERSSSHATPAATSAATRTSSRAAARGGADASSPSPAARRVPTARVAVRCTVRAAPPEPARDARSAAVHFVQPATAHPLVSSAPTQRRMPTTIHQPRHRHRRRRSARRRARVRVCRCPQRRRLVRAPVQRAAPVGDGARRRVEQKPRPLAAKRATTHGDHRSTPTAYDLDDGIDGEIEGDEFDEHWPVRREGEQRPRGGDGTHAASEAAQRHGEARRLRRMPSKRAWTNAVARDGVNRGVVRRIRCMRTRPPVEEIVEGRDACGKSAEHEAREGLHRQRRVQPGSGAVPPRAAASSAVSAASKASMGISSERRTPIAAPIPTLATPGSASVSARAPMARRALACASRVALAAA